MLARLGILLAIASCLQPASTTCPGGIVCAENAVCVVVREADACTTRDDLAACVEPPENGICDPSDERKRCIEGVCIDLCGNRRVDLGEECDDGDRIADDACSAACLVPRCGNGSLDPGEACDEGPARSGDGCSSSCAIEFPRWTRIEGTIAARAYTAMATTATMPELSVLVFGGYGERGFLDDTWAFDGNWQQQLPARSPPARSHHGMAYDSARDRVVVFGGLTAGGAVGDTWEWDGRTWTERTPPVSPPKRQNAQLAYVPSLGVVVMGGVDGDTKLIDTWAWDGTTWSQLATQYSTFAGSRTHLAFLPDVGGGTLFACVAGNDLPFPKLVQWSTTTASWSAVGDCIADLQVLVARPLLGGGTSLDALDLHGRYWTRSGATWEMPSPQTAIPGYGQAIASIGGDRLALFGGHANDQLSQPAFSAQLYEGVSGLWGTSREANARPTAKQRAVVAFDPIGAYGLQVGGNGEIRTWRWSLRGWERAPIPPGEFEQAPQFAFDELRRQFVMWGATGTQLFDGTTWIPQNPSQKPPHRNEAMLAWDGERVILFGGVGHDDTWAWDGVTWTAIGGAMPSVRANAAIAYDPITERVIMFGGRATDGDLADTWAWDGSTWTDVTPIDPPAAPVARSGARMAFDAIRGRVVLFGGGGAASSTLGDVWEWVADHWELVLDDRSVTRTNHAMFFDPVRGGIVTFGGVRDPAAGVTAETWILRYEAAGPRETCVAAMDLDGDGAIGCADPDCEPRCRTCGDGTCDTAHENLVLCPADCQ